MKASVEEKTTSIFKSVSTMAMGAVNFAQLGAQKAGEVMMSTADNLGIKSHVEAAEKAARRAAKDGGKKFADANSKARRLATKALDFDDEDESLASSDYDLLLSAAGAIEKTVNIYATYTQTFAVPAGSAFVWKARVKHYDIGFAVREVREQEAPVDVQPLTKYRSEALIQGQLPPSNLSRNIMLVFDNSYSTLQAKRFVYWVACGENVSLADDAVGAARTKEVRAAEEGPCDQ